MEYPTNVTFRAMKRIACFSVIALLLVSCSDRSDDLFILRGDAQGSSFTIKYNDTAHVDMAAQVDSVFELIDNSLSLWVEGSSINTLNSGDSVTIQDPHLFAVLAKAQDVHWDTHTAFDPTVDTLMRFWGFRGRGGEPDTNRLAGVMQHIGLGRMLSHFDWHLEDSTRATLTYSGADRKLTFDPNGIAQGYTVDVLAGLFDEAGIVDYMIEVGGEVRVRGKHPQNRSWRMQIDKPVEGDTRVRQAVIELNEGSMATSGNYRKFREINGKKYGHTIDPRTGYPVQHGLLSATVLAEECAIADALATAFMVMGEEESKKWLDEHTEVKAYLIMDDGNGGMRTWQSPGVKIEEAKKGA